MSGMNRAQPPDRPERVGSRYGRFEPAAVYAHRMTRTSAVVWMNDTRIANRSSLGFEPVRSECRPSADTRAAVQGDQGGTFGLRARGGDGRSHLARAGLSPAGRVLLSVSTIPLHSKGPAAIADAIELPERSGARMLRRGRNDGPEGAHVRHSLRIRPDRAEGCSSGGRRQARPSPSRGGPCSWAVGTPCRRDRRGLKALVRVGGLSLAARAVRSLLAAGIERVVVVVGYQAGPVATVVNRIAPGRARAVFAESWERGNGASLAAAEPHLTEERSFLLVTTDHVFGEGALELLPRRAVTGFWSTTRRTPRHGPRALAYVCTRSTRSPSKEFEDPSTRLRCILRRWRSLTPSAARRHEGTTRSPAR